jgi:hypothetical protein
MLDQDGSSEGLPPAEEPDKCEQEDEPEEPGIAVMPKDKVTKLNNYQSEFKDLVDARLRAFMSSIMRWRNELTVSVLMGNSCLG